MPAAFLLFLASLLSLPSSGAGAGAGLERALADVEWLVEEVGPRPAGGAAEAEAVVGIAARLREAGWQPTPLGCPRCVVACRDGRPGQAGQRLFLAHPDSVPGSPGAVDNAAGVAALLEVARQLPPGPAGPDLCLGFPAAEETGLEGARAMAAAWPAPLPELVVALDLTGHGRLSVTGLGPAWGGSDLDWLLTHADLDSPFTYRVVSRALPGMERSDHAPFAARGARAAHLLGRGPGGVFPAYHQPTDDHVDAEALGALVTALRALAEAPDLPPPAPDAAGTAGRRVLPAALTWTVIVLGLLSATWDLLRPARGWPVLGALRGLLSLSWRAALGLLPAAAATWVLARLGAPVSSAAGTGAEATAAVVMGLPPTGWWGGALFVLPVGMALLIGTRRALGPRGSAPLAAGLLGLLALTVDPLLAFPFGLAALLSRLHPLLATLPAGYLLLPDHLRELAFHALLPPDAWPLLWLLALPAFGAYSRRSPPPPAPPDAP